VTSATANMRLAASATVALAFIASATANRRFAATGIVAITVSLMHTGFPDRYLGATLSAASGRDTAGAIAGAERGTSGASSSGAARSSSGILVGAGRGTSGAPSSGSGRN